MIDVSEPGTLQRSVLDNIGFDDIRTPTGRQRSKPQMQNVPRPKPKRVCVRFPKSNGRWSPKRYCYYFEGHCTVGDWVITTKNKCVRVVATDFCSLENETTISHAEKQQATTKIKRLANFEEITAEIYKYGV